MKQIVLFALLVLVLAGTGACSSKPTADQHSQTQENGSSGGMGGGMGGGGY
ncbi:hypothetical protein [Hypericibacter sp.]|uniref:hypothetical protein n=1 Tax=Hypericibacter sp. TaxID=2705401 RepID=UPI003D6C738A